LRKLIRTFARTGQDGDVWPLALLLFAVLVPAVCLLWFMGAAMRNERFAARQKLADAYRSRLSSSQARLERHWNETAKELEKLARTAPPSAAFAKCVQSGHADSVIILDEQGDILYPNTPSAPPTPSSAPPDREGERGRGDGESEPKWAEANRLEYLRKDFIMAASRYGALAQESTNINVAARALQAQARCLVRAGRNDDAIRLVSEVLRSQQYGCAVDAQGRLIAANAELMVLELLTDRTALPFQATAQRLKQRLMDYDNPVLAASQRRFLMKELQALSPQTEFSTFSAEELAADVSVVLGSTGHWPVPSDDPPDGMKKVSPGKRDAVSDSASLLVPPGGSPSGTGEPPALTVLHRASVPGLWQFTTPDRRVLALVHSERLLASSRSAIFADNLATDAHITLLPPDVDNASAFVTLPAGEQLPGWRLALFLKDQTLFDTMTGHKTAVYLWTGVLVVAAMGVLTLLAVRLLRRQVALARLKNDLAATVSHELKTPLASMRVLVDTLLGSDKIDEQTAREYLQLIAQENERLSRLIQNFLTFSRMERRKYTFGFTSLPPRQITDTAINVMRERFEAPGCRFEVQVEDSLPDVWADPDALATALINLLDNAYKYSEDIKHIILRVRAENGTVVFSIRDNGIGIAPRETKKIFQPFHQVDERLSRKGSGCGLGLSIVQHIIEAHDGRVSVESQPGSGSTFTISIPAASKPTQIRKEATA
jgi:signal transduction histidine kinase